MWKNRFVHQQIWLKNAYILDDSQLIVVYTRLNKDDEVKRRIVRGPCVYMPLSNEWLHQFNWHTPDKENQGHLIHNSSVNKNASPPCEILTVKPDFFHYYVNEVRTSDDTVITVKLMLIYELVNAELMLNKTQDPISDFIKY